MNKFVFLLLCTFVFTTTFAQQAYFQQEVNYKIDVQLDDSLHLLQGNIEMEYINHSPDELTEIHLHLWGNAYKSRKTAFAKQMLRLGSTDFYFAKDKDLGYFLDLNFSVNGKSAAWEINAKHPDLAILTLNEPLKSGERISIQTPFTLKIPGPFSRLGHLGQSYQISQWYPKPAVYDAKGWHPMPYLDMGEFYSEFGRFEVSITLPQNYIVAATGVLQEAAEKQFLDQKAKESSQQLAQWSDALADQDDFPPSSQELKTISYVAEQVHDFAWFADKRFYVQKSAVELADGKQVETWAFFTNFEANLWKKATQYLDRSVKYYSELVGTYPYPHATAVESALAAGGGMEYPMITVIGASGTDQNLDEVITHEVGHNWFYGILGFNERDHPWMDEGFNSYYDHRYAAQHYTTSRFNFLPPYISDKSPIDIGELGYLYQARRNLDQAPETTSDDFSEENFVLGAYEKPAAAFKLLEEYLGKKTFDQAMQAFYEQWKFKHPQPEDFSRHLKEKTGKNLDWFFDGLLYSNGKVDYAIQNLTEGTDYELTVKNKGDIAVPFTVSGLKNGKIIHEQSYEGFTGTKAIHFEKKDCDQLILDAQHVTLDVNRRNNNSKTSGAFKKMEPLQFKLGLGVENPRRTSLYWLPLLTWNRYDGAMVGLGLYNVSIPKKAFEFSLAPMYAISSKDLVGLANFKYHLFPTSKLFHQIIFDLGLKRYTRSYNEQKEYHLNYSRVVPSVTFEFGRNPKSEFRHQFQLRSLLLNEELATFSQDSIGFGDYLGNENESSHIFELTYHLENNRAVNPFGLTVALEQQSYSSIKGDQSYLKASLELKTSYTYNVGRNIDLRLFVGGFLINTERNAGNVSNRSQRGSYSLTSEGFNDYKYDGLFLGRSENTGVLSQQISLQDGGMKNAFGSSQSSNLGNSNNFIVAFNLKADLPQRLPFGIPLKPYFDIGYYDNAQPTGAGDTFSDQLVWSGGLMLDFFDGIAGVYFPIVNSSNLKAQYQQRGNFFTRITYSLDFKRINPLTLINGIGF